MVAKCICTLSLLFGGIKEVQGFSIAQQVKNLSTMQETQEAWFDHWVRKIPRKRIWQPSLVFLPEKFHGQRNLAYYGLLACKESDTTE